MFCPECGFWVQKSYSYCPGCEKALINIESSSLSDKSTITPLSVGSSPSPASYVILGLPRDPGSNTTPTVAAAKNLLSRPLTFDQFNKKTYEERQGLSLRGSQKESKTDRYGHPSGAADDVTSNIGIMVAKHDGQVNIVRGKGLPLKIKKDAKSDEILQAALKKRLDFDCSFHSDYLY